MKKKFMAQCEREVQELAKLRPILCPVFEVMKANLNDCYESMSVTDFVDMCLTIAESRS